jgi:PKD repeat protein
MRAARPVAQTRPVTERGDVRRTSPGAREGAQERDRRRDSSAGKRRGLVPLHLPGSFSVLRMSLDVANRYIAPDSWIPAASEEGVTRKLHVIVLVLVLILVSGVGSLSLAGLDPGAAGLGNRRGPGGATASAPGSFPVTAMAVSPTLTSLVSPTSITLGAGTFTAEDTATLSFGFGPTGSITFSVYTAASCTGPTAFTSTKTVTDNGTYPSDTFTVPRAGTYYWQAVYSGDANNNAASTTCADPTETLTVSMASPSVATSVAPASFQLTTVSSSATDTATLSGGFIPTGSITFSVYATGGCTGSPVFTSSKTVSGNGNYRSSPFTATAAGTYQWIAAYSGDSSNNPFTPACVTTGETLTVALASPTATTLASPANLVLGTSPGTATDTATLSGGFNPTGTISFRLYVNDSTCAPANLVFTSSAITVSGNAAYTSNAFTPSDIGTYYWVTSYSGDTNNNPFTGACAASGETLSVTKGGPGLTTLVSPTPVTLGSAPPYTATDTATLSGGFKPKGTITFTVFTNAACSGTPVFTSTANVNGNGAYPSSPFTIPGAATYYWIAAYSGDSRNLALTTHCGDPGEILTVNGATPGVTTQVSPTSLILNASRASTATDTATLSGGFQPTGSITFTVFNAAGCLGSPVFTSVKTVSGNGAYTSAAFTVPAAGTYYWVALYSGDGSNAAFNTTCGDPNEVLTVLSGVSPLASFTFSPAISGPNDNVRFDASGSRATISGGVITSYSWQFGDGNDLGPISSPTAKHAYLTWGHFTVTLNVTDSYGYTNRTSGVVDVDALPIATFDTLHALAKVGRPFLFNGSDSHDPDGNVTSWTWKFGDGGTGSGAVVNHVYQVTGVYNVTLTVVDNNGFSGSITKAFLVVYPQPPVAGFSISPTRPPADTLVTFNGSLSTDSDALIVAYKWQFGDGSIATGMVVTHRYDRAGSYSVQLTVTDEDNMSSASTSSLFVVTVPTVGFTFAPGSPTINATVTFTATGSLDASGVLTYNWTFGDGTVGTGYEANKTYSGAGTYNVTLSVTNIYGVSRSFTKKISISPSSGGTSLGLTTPGLSLMMAVVLDALATVAMVAYVFIVVRRKGKPPTEQRA